MSVVSLAQSLIGKVRYSFGANNVSGGVGDCSSFTQYVYAQNGISIGRDTTTQLSNVSKISKSQLQAGDLVFFQGTYRSGVSHVGIYIGNGQFIHNSSSVGGVTTGNLSDSYWQKHWLTGGRVSGASSSTLSTSSSTTNTSVGSKIADWLGINEIMKNVAVILLIALCMIIGVLFFVGAWDIDIDLPI